MTVSGTSLHTHGWEGRDFVSDVRDFETTENQTSQYFEMCHFVQKYGICEQSLQSLKGILEHFDLGVECPTFNQRKRQIEVKCWCPLRYGKNLVCTDRPKYFANVEKVSYMFRNIYVRHCAALSFSNNVFKPVFQIFRARDIRANEVNPALSLTCTEPYSSLWKRLRTAENCHTFDADCSQLEISRKSYPKSKMNVVGAPHSRIFPNNVLNTVLLVRGTHMYSVLLQLSGKICCSLSCVRAIIGVFADSAFIAILHRMSINMMRARSKNSDKGGCVMQ